MSRNQASHRRVHFEKRDGTIIRPFEDYGIRLSKWQVSPPVPKTYFVDLDGMDGSLDLTEWAGVVRYSNREITMDLRARNTANKSGLYAINGKEVKITFTTDPDYYYVGRCTKITETHDNVMTDISMTFSCYPYKYKVGDTVFNITTVNGESFTIRARRMPTRPVFTTDQAVSLSIDGETYTNQTGTFTIPGLVLTETPLEIDMLTTGASLVVKWQDGDF